MKVTWYLVTDINNLDHILQIKRRITIMKKRFLLVVVSSICILFSLAVDSVNAQYVWYSGCTVQASGSQDGLGLVNLKGGTPALPEGWYTIGRDTTEANQGMATALTAYSTGGTVGVSVDLGITVLGYPVIRAIVVLP
jgi:hypothetical protein